MENNEKCIGSHSVRFEEPDIVLIRMCGDVQEEHARVLCDELERLAKGKGYLLILGDLTELGAMSAKARHVFAEHGPHDSPVATAMFGASFRARVLVNMVITVSRLFKRHRRSYHFVETEAQARACLDEMRRRLTRG
jgi:hypothetical protein